MIKEYVGEGGKATLSHQSAPPESKWTNGQYHRICKDEVSLSGGCPESRYEPSRSLHPHALGSRCYLHLGWNILSKLGTYRTQSGSVSHFCFTVFAPLKCSSLLLPLFLSLNDTVSVYASVFQTDRETEKEAADFALCT